MLRPVSYVASFVTLALVTAAAVMLYLAQPVSAQTYAVGSHANAWNAVAVLVSGVSNSIDTNRCQSGYTTAFGNTGGAATLTVQYSQDNVSGHFYSSAINTGAVTGNFGISFSHGARYVRLISSAAVTITATLACK